MIKGCQREMIVMETHGSTLFERAYFILRKEKRSVASADMLAEANRLIGVGCAPNPRRRRRTVFAFLLGVGVGVGVFFLLRLAFRI